MMYRASDFYKLAKLSEVYIRVQPKNCLYQKTIKRFESHKHLIDKTLLSIQTSAESGGMCVYIPEYAPFWKTPEIHDFFRQSGYTLDKCTIRWGDKHTMR